MIDEGHWKEMSKAAHAVYIAMRGLAGKEEEQKAYWVKVKGKGVETYRVPYMKVKATKTKIAKAAGISPRRINNVLKELMHMLLVNPMRYDQKKQLPKGKEWKVYVVPVYSPAVKSEDLFEAEEDLIPIKYDEEYGATDDLETGHSKFKKRHFDSKKRHSVTESSLTSSQTNSQEPEKEEASNSFHSLKASSYEMGLQEEKSIGDQESAPGEPGALTSRSDAPVRSPDAPVREKLANHITTDWNKRDCQQCMYRDNDDGAEYCTMASSEQENTIGEMEYCPKDE
jgi:hypothetical protein